MPAIQSLINEIICYKRYVEGKNSDQIARETYHSIEAVDRYLGQFDRIRLCLQQGMETKDFRQARTHDGSDCLLD